MIFKQCIMTIAKNVATLDEDIYLFRLDKNIELHFMIVNNRYKFDKSDLNNIIAQTQAAYFQIRLYKNADIKYVFTIQPTDNGKAILKITDDLIDDPIEVGDYDFQISLLDADKSSMISMPIVSKQLHVCEPLVGNDAVLGKAVLGLSELAEGEIKNAFDSEGNYIREIHNNGEILSAALINKFEEANEKNAQDIKNLNTDKLNTQEIKTDINNIKTNLGTEELTTTAKDVKGAINEVNSQIKEKATTQYVTEEIAKAQLEGAGVDTSNFIVNSDLTALENEVGLTRTRLDNLFIGDFKTAHTGTWSGSQTVKTSNINKCNVSKEFLSGKYFCVINFDLNFNEALTSASPYVTMNLKGSGFNNNTDLSDGGIIPSKYNLTQYNNNILLAFVTELTETKNAWIALSLVGLNQSATRTYEANIHWATIIKVDDYNERYDSLVIDNNYLEQYVIVNNNGKVSSLQGEVSSLQGEVSELQKLCEKKQNIVDYWGDSLTYGNQDGTGITRATVLKGLLGDNWTVNNYGNGGETSNTVACRQGGLHLIAQPDFTIPATITAVSIDIVDSDGNAVNLRSSITNATILDSVNPVEINGVKGNLGQGSTFGASPYTFTRLEAGDSVHVNRPTRIITKAMRELNGSNNVMIIWIGQNGGYNNDVNELIYQIRQMIKLNKTEKYLIISLTSGGKESINNSLKKEFGVKFIDARAYLISYGLDDANITPTQQDLDNINNNLLPKSLLVEKDNVHFNQHGYTVIANLEYERGKVLGYW